jgi:hypothetical protein
MARMADITLTLPGDAGETDWQLVYTTTEDVNCLMQNRTTPSGVLIPLKPQSMTAVWHDAADTDRG